MPILPQQVQLEPTLLQFERPMKRLLYILHAYHNRGGTEQHTKDLAQGLKDDFEIAILYPENGALHLQLADGSLSSIPVPPLPIPETPVHSDEHTAALSQFIRSFKPDLIHVQHFVFWPLDILRQLSALQIPTVISFHDYYPLHPYFPMVGASDLEAALSPAYSQQIFGSDKSAYLQARFSYIRDSLQHYPHKIVPSAYLQNFLSRSLGGDFRVIEHGIRPFHVAARNANPTRLKFGCIGSLLPQKGWRSLAQGFQITLKQHPELELHFYGGGEIPPSPAPSGIFFHGPYEQGDIPSILNEFDIGIIPSVFAETFSLVLSELWLAAKPVAVSDIGALGDRVKDRLNGRKFRPGDPMAIAEVLNYFCDNDDWRSWHAPKVRLLPEMLEDYRSLYQGVIAEGR